MVLTLKKRFQVNLMSVMKKQTILRLCLLLKELCFLLKTEIKFAAKSKFDLYTITNFSFAELAFSLNMRPNMFAVTKHDLSNRDEEV